MNDRSDRENQRQDDIRANAAYGDEGETPLVPPPERESTSRSASMGTTEPTAPLFTREEAEQLRTRWESVQAGFVDEPRRAVEEADGLVRTVMERLTDGFTDQRERLEREWGQRDEISTEDLRMALRHYRSFFDRLLQM